MSRLGFPGAVVLSKPTTSRSSSSWAIRDNVSRFVRWRPLSIRDICELLVPTSSASCCWLRPLSILYLISSHEASLFLIALPTGRNLGSSRVSMVVVALLGAVATCVWTYFNLEVDGVECSVPSARFTLEVGRILARRLHHPHHVWPCVVSALCPSVSRPLGKPGPTDRILRSPSSWPGGGGRSDRRCQVGYGRNPSLAEGEGQR